MSIPGFLSVNEAKEWLAHGRSLSPRAFLEQTRRSELDRLKKALNDANCGALADVDADGDLTIVITDCEKHFDFWNGLGTVEQSEDAEAYARRVMAQHASVKERRRDFLKIAQLCMDQVAVSHPRLRHVPVDVVPKAGLNAWAQPVPGGGDIIAIHESFLQSWVWNEWYAYRWLETVDSPLTDPRISGDRHSLTAWKAAHAAVIQETRVLAQAIIGRSRESGDTISRFSRQLQQLNRTSRGSYYAATMVVIALFHECGHIALGHTDSLRLEIERRAADHSDQWMPRLERTAQMRTDEFAADAFAARAFLSMAKADAPSVGHRFRDHIVGLSALMLFALFHYSVEASEYEVEDLECTHPRPGDRLPAFMREMGISSLNELRLPGFEL